MKMLNLFASAMVVCALTGCDWMKSKKAAASEASALPPTIVNVTINNSGDNNVINGVPAPGRGQDSAAPSVPRRRVLEVENTPEPTPAPKATKTSMSSLPQRVLGQQASQSDPNAFDRQGPVALCKSARYPVAMTPSSRQVAERVVVERRVYVPVPQQLIVIGSDQYDRYDDRDRDYSPANAWADRPGYDHWGNRLPDYGRRDCRDDGDYSPRDAWDGRSRGWR